MSVERLVSILAEEADLTAREIADLLWLALLIQPEVEIPPEQKLQTQTVRQEESIDDTVIEAPLPVVASKPVANINTSISQSSDVLPPNALPIWIADPPILSDTLSLIRALRPLLKQVEVGISNKLDETATVERIARTQIWDPILKPEIEPWFEVVLIVDRSTSMNLWRRLTDDITLMLKRYGAFRDLRILDLELVSSEVVLRFPQGNAARTHSEDNSSDHSDQENPSYDQPRERFRHDPRELIEPNGRRIILILSDCVASYWWDGKLNKIIQAWSESMPTAIWQMLPEWMWERTALGQGNYVAIRNTISGAINTQLETEILGLETPKDVESRAVIPVITSEAEDLCRWSRMLSGDRREVTAGFLLPQYGKRVPKAESVEEIASERFHNYLIESKSTSDTIEQPFNQAIAEIAQERLQEWRLLSSPRARRLIMLLAASPVITLPVMRLIRASMLPEISPLPIAEVFLSGLFKKLPQQENAKPEEIQYDFMTGVRAELLNFLPPVEVIEVVNKISFYVAQRLNYTSLQEFRAFLTNPEAEKPELEGLKSFASVTASILERLGGDYAGFAKELRQGAGEVPASNQIPANFPQLQTFEYEFGEITDILERFEFETATISRETIEKTIWLVRRTTNQEWVIRRSRRATWGYTEPLDDEIGLEMISIPAGTFLMGAPEDEPKSYDDERPQHQVTLKPFYMSRYTVTQAQWQFVAGYPRIERELNSDPSDFKGDNRPVETVSWLDATEFCQRLSSQTGREYKLPSEAQWEYACRAGTQTPFHFGETITTELANYDGSYTYNGSPKGEYREQTTDVGSFPANVWGLHDMHGNVWEWCEDDGHPNYEGAPDDGTAWRDEDRTNTDQVLRGGSWIVTPINCRSAYRVNNNPRDIIDYYVGFRVVCVVPGTLLSP